MWYDWDLLYKKVKHWKELFWDVYNSIGNKEFRLEMPLHVKVRIEPFTYKEYKIDTLLAAKGFADEFIRFNLSDQTCGDKCTIDVYPAFELKSNSKIVNEEIIFEILIKYFKQEGFFNTKKAVVTETVVV